MPLNYAVPFRNVKIPRETARDIQMLVYRQLCKIAQGNGGKEGFLDNLAADSAIGGRLKEFVGKDNVKAWILRNGTAPRRTKKNFFRLRRAPDPLQELKGLIGLEAVKAQVTKTINLINLGRERSKAGLPRLDITHHLVFMGNPGTGKTTVARLVGRIYKDLGVLKSGHMIEVDRSDLVAPYIGQTALRVKEVVMQAMDGVLFIDEAYSLASANPLSGDFGAEATQTLIKLMEDFRGRLVVIVAGYTGEMKQFISSNPGIASRFKTFIEFSDYSGEDLFKILNHMCEISGCRLSMEAMIEGAVLMNSLKSGHDYFGNARTVRNVFEECLARQAARLEGRKGAKVDVRVLEPQDIPKPGELQGLLTKVV